MENECRLSFKPKFHKLNKDGSYSELDVNSRSTKSDGLQVFKMQEATLILKEGFSISGVVITELSVNEEKITKLLG